MRMEPLLFADENAPEWAFSKRKGVMLEFEIIQNNDDDIPIDYYYREGFLIPETGIKNTIWNSYIDYTDESDSFKLSSFLIYRLYDKNHETSETIERQFSKIIIEELLYIGNEKQIYHIMNDPDEPMYEDVWNAYLSVLEDIVQSYHENGDKAFQ